MWRLWTANSTRMFLGVSSNPSSKTEASPLAPQHQSKVLAKLEGCGPSLCRKQDPGSSSMFIHQLCLFHAHHFKIGLPSSFPLSPSRQPALAGPTTESPSLHPSSDLQEGSVWHLAQQGLQGLQHLRISWREVTCWSVSFRWINCSTAELPSNLQDIVPIRCIFHENGRMKDFLLLRMLCVMILWTRDQMPKGKTSKAWSLPSQASTNQQTVCFMISSTAVSIEKKPTHHLNWSDWSLPRSTQKTTENITPFTTKSLGASSASIQLLRVLLRTNHLLHRISAFVVLLKTMGISQPQLLGANMCSDSGKIHYQLPKITEICTTTLKHAQHMIDSTRNPSHWYLFCVSPEPSTRWNLFQWLPTARWAAATAPVPSVKQTEGTTCDRWQRIQTLFLKNYTLIVVVVPNNYLKIQHIINI